MMYCAQYASRARALCLLAPARAGCLVSPPRTDAVSVSNTATTSTTTAAEQLRHRLQHTQGRVHLRAFASQASTSSVPQSAVGPSPAVAAASASTPVPLADRLAAVVSQIQRLPSSGLPASQIQPLMRELVAIATELSVAHSPATPPPSRVANLSTPTPHPTIVTPLHADVYRAARDVYYRLIPDHRVLTNHAVRGFFRLQKLLDTWPTLLTTYQNVLRHQVDNAAPEKFFLLPKGGGMMTLHLLWEAVANDSVNPRWRNSEQGSDGPQSLPDFKRHLISLSTSMHLAGTKCTVAMLEQMAYVLAFDARHRPDMKAMYDWWRTHPARVKAEDAAAADAATQRAYQLMMTGLAHQYAYDDLASIVGDYLAYMVAQPVDAALLLPTPTVNQMLFAVLLHAPDTIVSLVAFLQRVQASAPTTSGYGLDVQSCELLLSRIEESPFDLAAAQATLQSVLATLTPSTQVDNFHLHSITDMPYEQQWSVTIDLLRQMEQRCLDADPQDRRTVSPDLACFSHILRIIETMHRNDVPFSVLHAHLRPLSDPVMAASSSFSPLSPLLYQVDDAPSSWMQLADRLHQSIESMPFNQLTGNVYLPMECGETYSERYMRSICFLTCRALRRTAELTGRRTHNTGRLHTKHTSASGC